MTAVRLPLLDSVRAVERPSLARLTLVELRKMTDTRSGFWLLGGSALLTVAIVSVFCVFAHGSEIDFAATLEVAVQPASVLLPILGVLLVTSEWSQRTAMITFALVPHRSRVFTAKLAAGVLLSLGVIAICLPAAAIGTAIAGDSAHTWALSGDRLGRLTLSVVISMFMGLGFGALLLNSAPAVVLYFVLPLVSVGLGAIPQIDPVTKWLDATRTLAPLTGKAVSAIEWAHMGTTLALWIGVPLLVGLWRISRAEVS